jgi:hypothetical protein
VGETIDQTRLEIAAQRAELEATAARLRESLDLRRRLRENPVQVIGIGAVTVFLVAGGPRRLARFVRRRTAPNAALEAYEALPASMQAWVDALAGEAGGKASAVRDELVEELGKWRREPIRDRKARKELAKQMVEGPPGPGRTAWNAAEAAFTLLAAAAARRAIARFLTDEQPARRATKPAAGDAPTSGNPAGEATGSAEPPATEYAGWSSRE